MLELLQEVLSIADLLDHWFRGFVSRKISDSTDVDVHKLESDEITNNMYNVIVREHYDFIHGK